MPEPIRAGDPVIITDASGTEIRTVALSGVETKGHNFPVIWVARPLIDGRTERCPWPIESVRRAADA